MQYHECEFREKAENQKALKPRWEAFYNSKTIFLFPFLYGSISLKTKQTIKKKEKKKKVEGEKRENFEYMAHDKIKYYLDRVRVIPSCNFLKYIWERLFFMLT